MEERHYRILLAIIGGIAAVVLVVRIGELAIADADGAKLGWTTGGRIVGLALLPVAIAGLWSWRTWGFWLLGLATLVALVAAIPDGLFAAFWRTFLAPDDDPAHHRAVLHPQAGSRRSGEQTRPAVERLHTTTEMTLCEECGLRIAE